MPDSLSDLLREAALAHPDRPALSDRGRVVTYAELDGAAQRVADRIERLGVAPGARLGLLRRKDIDTIVALHGTLRAGCAYVPLDPRAGEDRLAAIVRDASMPLLFTEPLVASRFGSMLEALGFDCAEAVEPGGTLLVCRSRGTPSSSDRSREERAAYILYTSGSTGAPKGVEHTHASALAFTRWAADKFRLTNGDRLSCHAPLHFDLTTFDLFAAAERGACVVLIPEDLAMFPTRIAELVAEEHLTVWYSVPFALMQLVDRGGLAERRLHLREVIFAGERYPPDQLRRLAAALPGVRLSNLFGPTETNVCTYHHLTTEDLERDEFCPIGRPCPYAVLRIEDGGAEVPEGRPGELLVGGASVMRGYLNRPELNAAAFDQAADGTRFYRTGDVVTADPDGTLRFHGRRDRQVKVRGFRLELDDVEAALGGCTGVVAAAAWVERAPDGGAEVVAAVEHGGARPSEPELIRAVARRLAPAAVPRRITVMDRLPRTPNEKVDYTALAGPAPPGRLAGQRSREATS